MMDLPCEKIIDYKQFETWMYVYNKLYKWVQIFSQIIGVDKKTKEPRTKPPDTPALISARLDDRKQHIGTYLKSF